MATDCGVPTPKCSPVLTVGDRLRLADTDLAVEVFGRLSYTWSGHPKKKSGKIVLSAGKLPPSAPTGPRIRLHARARRVRLRWPIRPVPSPRASN
jgi:hypothetical protein